MGKQDQLKGPSLFGNQPQAEGPSVKTAELGSASLSPDRFDHMSVEELVNFGMSQGLLRAIERETGMCNTCPARNDCPVERDIKDVDARLVQLRKGGR